jgi:hypothetical protein
MFRYLNELKTVDKISTHATTLHFPYTLHFVTICHEYWYIRFLTLNYAEFLSSCVL